MKKNINIAIIGLGQIGIYLYNEIKNKKRSIELKTGKKIRIVAISAKDINKKRRFFILTLLKLLMKKILTFYLNVSVYLMVSL